MTSVKSTHARLRLDQCLERIVDNRGRTPPLSSDGIEMIEINALEDKRKSPAYENIKKFVSKETYATWFRSGHPKRGDTLISTVGAIGRVAYFHAERGCIAQNIIALRPRRDILDPEFLYYYLASTDTQARLANLNIGVAQPSLKVPHLMAIEISTLPLPIQRRIASILSAYDDLIENHRKRIAILEEMARRLYREWFVHFRYPGHESVPLVDSPLGKIPRGWRESCLGLMCENFDRLRRPLSGIARQSRPGPYRYYGAAKPMDSIDAFTFDGEYLLLAEDGSVITTDRRPVLQLVRACPKFAHFQNAFIRFSCSLILLGIFAIGTA